VLTTLGRVLFYACMALWLLGGVVLIVGAQTTSMAACGGVLIGTCGTACVSVWSLDRALTRRRRTWDNERHVPR
jgi:hypothetical protein